MPILIDNQRKAIKKLDIDKYWQGCRDIGTPIHHSKNGDQNNKSRDNIEVHIYSIPLLGIELQYATYKEYIAQFQGEPVTQTIV